MRKKDKLNDFLNGFPQKELDKIYDWTILKLKIWLAIVQYDAKNDGEILKHFNELKYIK